MLKSHFASRLTRALTVAVLMVLLTAGCGEESAGADEARGVLEFVRRGGGEEVADALVIDCMADEGYVLRPSERLALRSDLRAEEERLGRLPFAEEAGYGIASRLEALLAAEAADNSPRRASLDDENAFGPYYVALYGEMIALESSRGTAQPEGCTGAATESMAALFELESSLIDLGNGIESDDRLLEAERQWVDCMVGHGYDDADRLSWGRDWVSRETSNLMSSAKVWLADGSRSGIQRLSPVEVVDRFEVDGERLAALIERSKRMAVADARCYADVSARIETVRTEYEDIFVRTENSKLNDVRLLMLNLDMNVEPVR